MIFPLRKGYPAAKNRSRGIFSLITNGQQEEVVAAAEFATGGVRSAAALIANVADFAAIRAAFVMPHATGRCASPVERLRLCQSKIKGFFVKGFRSNVGAIRPANGA